MIERIRSIAREHVRPRNDLNVPHRFPHDLWAVLAGEGLLGFGVPAEFGGIGASILEQAAAAEALARGGRSLGVAVAWQSHNTLSRFFFDRFGSADQRARWLPEMAAGRITPAVAISEPGSGAHPKHLQTAATEDGDTFILNGQKAFVTNGTIAGVFVVLAITSIDAGRKRFTAFLVERDAPGLSFTEAGAVDGLYPVGHCGLRFEDCRVGRDAILGTPGSAYEKMAQPLRDYEDMLGIATLTGGMGAVLDLFRDGTVAGEIDLGPDQKERLGGMAATATAVAQLGRTVLSGDVPEGDRTTVLLAARRFGQGFLDDLDVLVPEIGPATLLATGVLRRDLSILAGVARQVARLRLRRLADSVLSQPA